MTLEQLHERIKALLCTGHGHKEVRLLIEAEDHNGKGFHQFEYPMNDLATSKENVILMYEQPVEQEED